MLARLRDRFDAEAVNRTLAAKTHQVRRLRPARSSTVESARRFWDRIIADTDATEADRDFILDTRTAQSIAAYDANIENLIGTIKVPVGIIRPLRVNGIHAQGDFLVPLATSEAALVASYGRGADVTAGSGGISAALTYDGVLRTRPSASAPPPKPAFSSTGWCKTPRH